MLFLDKKFCEMGSRGPTIEVSNCKLPLVLINVTNAQLVKVQFTSVVNGIVNDCFAV